MDHIYITEQGQLVELCHQYQRAEVLVIDTEFVRTRTLYPRLGLLQAYDGNTLALIDPVALDDLTPFWQLLENSDVRKVLHACSEDLEVFLHRGKVKPSNLIDSQIMMAFLGHGISVGYAAMVKHFLAIELDKSESRTDWTKRPLSDKQLRYAAADVEHLFTLYPKLLAQLSEAGWLAAAEQESEALVNRKFTPTDESQLYQTVKMAWRLRPEQLNRLQHLALWRYQQAQKRDLPLGFVAKDHTLLALAQYNPKSVGAMAGLEGAEVQDIRHKGKAMLSVLKAANQAPADSYPPRIVRLDQYPGYKQTYKRLKEFLQQIAQEHQLAMENLASKKQMNQFLSWHYKINNADKAPEQVDLIQGWRAQLLAERLTDFSNNKFIG